MSALLAVAAAFVAGFAVSEAHGGDTPAYHLTATGLDTGLSCDRLTQWYVTHGVDQVTPWGWSQPVYAAGAPMAGSVAEDSVAPRASAPGSSLDTRTSSDTGTNVQEADVDEPDIVKASGDLLVRIENGTLETYDVSGSQPRRTGVAPLDRIGDPQLLLAGDRAVVIGTQTDDPAAGAPLVAAPSRTWVRTYDLEDPAVPNLVDSRVYDGSLVTARQVGSVLRLVLDTGLPSLDFTQPSSTVSQDQALAHNRRVVRESTASDWFPHVTTFSGGRASSGELLGCADVAVPVTFDGLGTLTIVGFDPADPSAADTTAVTTGSDTAYMSSTHLYVAMSPWSRLWHGWGPPTAYREPSTRIYGFDLSGTSAQYVGMGSVDGTVGGSWSMDEHDGVLRVAASTFPDAASTSVVLLRPEFGRLTEIGRLDGLGSGQRLTSVRWFDDIAVLVTFRQVDPFYVVDLADPTDPRVLGALHLPGWSSYLHPVGPHLVLGLGQTSPREIMVEPPQPMPRIPTLPRKPTLPPAPVPPTPSPLSQDDQVLPQGTATATVSGTVTATATGGDPVDPPIGGWGIAVPQQRAKATLFDISDLAHPRDVDTVSYPTGSAAMAGGQPHQVTWLPDRQTLLTVISGSFASPGLTPQTTQPVLAAWVSVLTVRDGSLRSRLVPVPETSQVQDIRTLPLDDGRVVLVAGPSVRFLTV